MNIIKRFVFIFLMFSVWLIPSSVYAINGTVNIGIVNDNNFSDDTTSKYSRSCIESVFNYIDNTNPNLVDTNTIDGISNINSGNIDLLSMIPMNDAFLSYLDFSSQPIGTGFLALYTNSDSQLFYKEFSQFQNIQIGILKNSGYEQQLIDYSKTNNFKYTSVYYNTTKELENAIKENKVDAVFIPATTIPQNMRLIAKCGEIEYYCAVKKGNTNLLNTINTALSELKENNPFYIANTYGGFFKTPYNNSIEITKAEYDALQDHKTLRILAPENNYPMSYFDSENNSYNGIYVDIVKQVADTAGFTIEFIPFNLSEMSMNGIVMGKADAILTVSDSTQGLISASEPYSSITYMPIIKKDTNIFEDLTLNVGILADDSWITDSLYKTHPQWNIQKYNSISSMFRAVESGNISIALLSSPDLQTKTSLLSHEKLSILNDFYVTVPIRLGVSKITCNQHTVDLLNKTIQNVAITDSELEKKFYTLSHTYIPKFHDLIHSNRHFLLLILCIFIIVIAIMKIRELHFKKLSYTDALTGIPNNQYFNTEALKIMDKNPNTPFLLASIDARNFKLINDRFGHVIGDQTLINIAQKIKNTFKDNGLYARSQGDSFSVLVEDNNENRKLLDSLVDMDIYIHNTTKYKVPIKIGVCPIPRYNPALSISRYLDRANIAKQSITGRNSNYLCYFTDEMNEQLSTKNVIESEMVQALNHGDFIVYYQPKYELKSDSIIGAEALVRWNHKERGIISPCLFIPLFEQNGFIIDLDFYVYESVFKMIRHRIDKKQVVIPISMNVSRCHLTDNDFIEKLEALVQKYRVPKEYVEIEITESIFSQDDYSAIALIYKLKDHGFTISMDDFGSGYSSLNLLRKVPIDTLKIDKVFIDNSENPQRSQVIVEEIISMATKISVKTICEGVETETQRDFLKRAGCNMVQGFFYSQPLPYSSFSSLLNSSN